jgi:hypothetical protein
VASDAVALAKYGCNSAVVHYFATSGLRSVRSALPATLRRNSYCVARISSYPAHYVWRRAVFGVHLGDESALIVLLSCP